MNKAYEIYLKQKWKEADDIACKCGCTDNKVIIAIFEKITQPYHYWLKSKEYS